MKKKTYQQPEMQVEKFEQTNIICTSGGYNEGNVRFNGGSDYTFDEDDF